ncbi:glycerol-3-phosphate 1-O-acyltransferase PlsY [Lentilactobacillus buchneri]|uniref:Glycerol-3-phosphate acyltransferase n=1 Tax=Lentilactobacillus buchneri subsp. silagei CD034 TaxID=1071400 RepID=J9W3N1_LENBU|nr:glycerol-3-phosphate 1-O-acyltransferase PlsY [Lentilactobacillus buchneri]MCC6100256.1 glycerol-3-phosphate 1-O-acyltransferase PlsY [Lactobacillus sp.]AFS00282.1 putative membrane protein [Lentilactobacillus buchneri subsp. silagei CD034]MCT2900338.1 glycerol-3-phosphate acyltransferase [Lentilactobacillus buchneri]MCT3541908.1 glycerol-3-phosphate acyltransferase [Lentilactobacillus buchneri]MCT3545025.1 glycerol-3-phosphate acyltransferase [Lentilactobacillus buchneri]
MNSNIEQIIMLLVLAYLLGSIPSGVWIGKIFFHIDIRRHGSGNIGTTNTYRVLGPIAGSIVMALDISKGAVATLLPTFFHITAISPLIFGLMAILGHTFSIFDKFKGGKAVATSAGMLLAYKPAFFFLAAGIWILVILLTSMVSLASMIGFTLTTIAIFFTHDILLSVMAVILTFFIFYRHRANINRIKNGTESMVPFGLGNRLRKRKDPNE